MLPFNKDFDKALGEQVIFALQRNGHCWLFPLQQKL
jgi:hypothetical protein